MAMAKFFFDRLLKQISYLFMSESKKRSHKIDEQLSVDKIFFTHFTHENLIMGVPRSGKSTLLQQLKKIYIDDGKIDEITKLRRRNDIRKYVMASIVDILSVTPLSLTSLKNLAVATWLVHNLEKSGLKCFEEHPNLPKNFFNLPNFFNILWRDEMIKKYLQTYGEFHLRDNLEYFFDQIDIIFKYDFVPTDEDVLRCPNFSNNMEELHIHFCYSGCNNKYIFIDTGDGENKQLKKLLSWIKQEGASRVNVPRTPVVKYIIMFIVDFSSPKQLYSSLLALESLVHTSYNFCYKIDIVLNKVDVFKKQILSGENLETFFADFPEFPNFYRLFTNDFQPRNSYEREEDPRVIAGIKFIIQKIEDDHDDYYDRYFMLNHILCGNFFSGVLYDTYVKRLLFDSLLHNRHTYFDRRYY